jgi:hypothetical protein
MSDRDRNACRAVARGAPALVVALLIAGHAYADPIRDGVDRGPPTLDAAQTDSARQSAPLPCSAHGNPGPFSVDCREASAAERSANFALAGAIIAAAQLTTLLGQIFALIITIRESHTATRAALDSVEASQRSAKAAEDAVTKSDEMLLHERDSAFRIERAYVYALTNSDNIAEAIDATLKQDPRYVGPNGTSLIWIKVAFKNYGKTPARLQEGTLHLQISDVPDQAPTTHAVGVACHYPLAAGEESTAIYLEMADCLTPDSCRAIASGIARLSLSGSVPYKDIWGNDQTCLLFWKYDFRVKCMVPDGSIQYDI